MSSLVIKDVFCYLQFLPKELPLPLAGSSSTDKRGARTPPPVNSAANAKRWL